jgi:CDGSH-type Zn-finger protein
MEPSAQIKAPSGTVLYSSRAIVLLLMQKERSLLPFARCGVSENKPYCDGTHAKIEFSDSQGATEFKLNKPKKNQVSMLPRLPWFLQLILLGMGLEVPEIIGISLYTPPRDKKS